MPRVLKKRCACGLTLVNDVCPGGCTAVAKPHMREKTTATRSREREKEAQRLPTKREVVEGFERAISRSGK